MRLAKALKVLFPCKRALPVGAVEEESEEEREKERERSEKELLPSFDGKFCGERALLLPRSPFCGRRRTHGRGGFC